MKPVTIAVMACSAICLALIGPARCQTNTSGGDMIDTQVQETFLLIQNEFNLYAAAVEFKVWQKEDNIEVNGWDIDISTFTNSWSAPGYQPEPHHSELWNALDIPETDDPDNGKHAVDVGADGVNVPFNQIVQIDVNFYLTSWNTVRLSDMCWCEGVSIEKAAPDFGWTVGFPEAVAGGKGFTHRLTVTNDDKTDAFLVTDFVVLPMKHDYDDLTRVPFSTHPDAIHVPDRLLNPGDSYVIDIPTADNYIGNHIYHTFKVTSPSGVEELIALSDHPVVPPCLYVEPAYVYASNGGASDFILCAGTANAKREYFLLGSMSGTAPGIPLPGGKAVLPLNWDVFTGIVIQCINSSMFLNFMGILDDTGTAKAQFDTLGPLPPEMIGMVMYYAYALNKPWNYASTPVEIGIL